MAARKSGSSPRASTRRASPRRAIRCPHWRTTAPLRRRRWLPARLPPSRIEFGILVNRVEAQFDPDARQVQRRVARDDFVGPARFGAGIEIDPALILLDDRILSDRGSGEVFEFLTSAIHTFSARR